MSRSRAVGLAVAVVASLVVALVLSVIVMLVWPGVIAHAAPWACPDGFPDPFVMEHVYSVPGETRRSWSLNCMSAHGALHQPGQVVPWLLVLAASWVPCLAVALLAASGRPTAAGHSR